MAAVGLGHRTARYYNYNNYKVLPTSGISPQNTSREMGLDDPLVITSLIAGLLGVTLTIILILSIWILRRAKHKTNHKKCPDIIAKYVEPVPIGSGGILTSTIIKSYPKETPV